MHLPRCRARDAGSTQSCMFDRPTAFRPAWAPSPEARADASLHDLPPARPAPQRRGAGRPRRALPADATARDRRAAAGLRVAGGRQARAAAHLRGVRDRRTQRRGRARAPVRGRTGPVRGAAPLGTPPATRAGAPRRRAAAWGVARAAVERVRRGGRVRPRRLPGRSRAAQRVARRRRGRPAAPRQRRPGRAAPAAGVRGDWPSTGWPTSCWRVTAPVACRRPPTSETRSRTWPSGG